MVDKHLLVAAAVGIAFSSPNASAAFLTQRVVDGLDNPLYLTSPPGDTRLFLLEKGTPSAARIKIYDRDAGTLNPAPFLTISGLSTGGEGGLLGLAFHPDYANNGQFYVNYTRSVAGSLQTEVARYTVSADPNVANPASADVLLRFAQPFANHNGGWMGFGPDGYLYIGSGDGGDANDPQGNGQSLDTLLGKMLRIDVNADAFPADDLRDYAIPADNPFAASAGSDEIWAYGLRNPWRASFDRLTGDLFIGDVGQGSREEINRQSAASDGGENYGWRLREGTIATPTPTNAPVGGPRPPGAVEPIYDYPHGSDVGEGGSVTGGYVYRGPIAELQGRYIFGDYISGQVWSINPDGSGFMNLTDLLDPDFGSIDNVSSFGEDSDGNLYIVDYDGEVFVLAPVPLPPAVALFASGVLALAGLRRKRPVA